MVADARGIEAGPEDHRELVLRADVEAQVLLGDPAGDRRAQ